MRTGRRCTTFTQFPEAFCGGRIANSAPEKLKATYFAVMASFTNLALSAAQLGTKYLNQVFVVTREVKDPATKAGRRKLSSLLFS